MPAIFSVKLIDLIKAMPGILRKHKKNIFYYISGHRNTERHLGTGFGCILKYSDIWGNEASWPPTDKGTQSRVFARDIILSLPVGGRRAVWLHISPSSNIHLSEYHSVILWLDIIVSIEPRASHTHWGLAVPCNSASDLRIHTVCHPTIK